MDPALKAYLDNLQENLTKASEDMRADIKDLKVQTDSQSTQVEALTAWQPDLEARFSKLQETVSVLQGAQSTQTAAAASGSTTTSDLHDPASHDEIHGAGRHDKPQFPRSMSSGGENPLAATPANGTLDFQTSMFTRLFDSAPGTSFTSSQIMASLGQTPPSLSFPNLRVRTQNFGRLCASNTFPCSRFTPPILFRCPHFISSVLQRFGCNPFSPK